MNHEFQLRDSDNKEKDRFPRLLPCPSSVSSKTLR